MSRPTVPWDWATHREPPSHWRAQRNGWFRGTHLSVYLGYPHMMNCGLLSVLFRILDGDAAQVLSDVDLPLDLSDSPKLYARRVQLNESLIPSTRLIGFDSAPCCFFLFKFNRTNFTHFCFFRLILISRMQLDLWSVTSKVLLEFIGACLFCSCVIWFLIWTVLK